MFLIDGNSFCYRAFYAIKELSNSRGMPTNAIFGVANMLRKVIKEHKPDMMAVVFDLKGPTTRHKKYEEYKILRKPMPEDLVCQIPRIKELITAHHIPIYELQGHEADDIIATLAARATRKGMKVVIVTSDKDALQLVNDDISVLSPHAKEGKVYDRHEVRNKYGVDPGSMVELMALMGDASDNIPGVKGIGQVTARKLLEEYGNVEGIYRNIENISSETLKEKLQKDKDMAMFSRELVILDTDLPVKLDIKNLRRSEPDTVKLAELYREFEFTALLREVMPKEEVRSGETKYKLCETAEEIEKITGIINECKIVAISIDVKEDDRGVLGIAFSWGRKEACYISGNTAKNGSTFIPAAVKNILENEKIIKAGCDLKKDLLTLAACGVKATRCDFDVMIADYLLAPSLPSHDLSSIAFRCLGYGLRWDRGSIEWDKKGQGTLDFAEKKKHQPACEKADVVFRLYEELKGLLKKKHLAKLFDEVEMPLVNVLVGMEGSGINIDIEYVQKMDDSMERRLEKVTKKIYGLAGEEFNINSPKQLQYVLFEKMRLPAGKKTKTGVSTDESVLRRLAEKHELPTVLLEYRMLSKLKTTYYDSILRLIDKSSGKLHTHFNQAVTATGRLSSSEPNLQNIPVRTPLGREIRKAFIPESKDRLLISADYSQIELRILAHLSEDKNMTKAFKNREDVHKFTASLIFDTPVNDVTDEMRVVAKTVNFGITYGMGPFRLAKDLGISIEEARTFIDSYFDRYRGVKKFIESTLTFVRKNGYVTTLLNRRRYIPEISSTNVHVKGFAERAAVNTPLQGSSADLIKLAMLAVSREWADGTETKMLLQVYDELIFTAPEKKAIDTAEKIRSLMESVMKLKVPIVVDVKIGRNWMDLEEVVFD
ncbi:MAG: DNA polymerase I [Candidatus Omnitrophica bacterium]|nr:DNA polymerase I [Candidatus Omnitrophota bacterium]